MNPSHALRAHPTIASAIASPRWALLLIAACWLAVLAGCATTPGMGGTETELRTAADDSDARKRARARLTLAASYFEHGQHAVALEEQKRAQQADPSFADAYNLGGLIYMAMGETQLAQANFQRAISLNGRDADAMHNLGWLYCQQGNHAESTAMFQRAVAVPGYTGRAKTLMTQGVCEARAGQTEAAEATLMRSYELDAGNPVTAFSLAKLLYNRGDNERAQFYTRRLNNSELANAESLWLGIKVERRLNNQQAVQQLASQLRRRFPQSPELIAYERGAFDD
ncbi:MAG: type IV pilus biogenesis/stability protein PilW [Pseudomonadota bacterium]|nr:type IV pilus biogenesis/stability protein PilW [Pseudomonadota bacterium]